MKRFKRVLKVIGKVLLILVFALAVVHGVLTYILGRKLEAKIQALKAKGEVVSLTELAGPNVPDSENAAVVYQQIYKEINKPGIDVDIWNLEKISMETERDKPETWEQARAAAPRLRRIVDLAEEATERPKCQWQTSWHDPIGQISRLFPDLARTRKLTRMLSALAILEARDGRPDEAMRLIQLSFKAGEQATSEPLLISLLVRYATNAITSKALREVVGYGGISESQAKELFDALGKMDVYSDYTRTLKGERAFSLLSYQSMARGDLGSVAEEHHVTRAQLALLRIGGYVARPFIYANELYALDVISSEIALGAIPARERGNDDSHAPFYALLAESSTSDFLRFAKGRDRAVAWLNRTRILLALVAFKDRFGAYPASLDEVEPKLGWALPEDPFSGKGFIYKRRGDGFLLYSIGENFKDDGGSDALIPSGTDGRVQADIAWELDH